MRTSSAKAKGRRGAQLAAKILQDLYKNKIMIASSGTNGEDLTIIRHPDDLNVVFSVEVKNQEKLNLLDAWGQCVANCPEGSVPLLCHTRNRQEHMFATMRLEDLVRILKR
jgi:hypothetical protein